MNTRSFFDSQKCCSQCGGKRSAALLLAACAAAHAGTAGAQTTAIHRSATFPPGRVLVNGLGHGLNFMASTDFDADGLPDLVTASTSLGQGFVLRNNPASPGVMKPVQTYTTAVGSGSVAVGDFNGDNRKDFATGNFDSKSLSVYFGSATAGQFTAGPVLTDPDFFPVIAAADLNGDGFDDLAAVLPFAGKVKVFLASSTTPGTFQSGVSYSGFPANPNYIVARDINGDSRPDLVTSHADTVNVLLNSPTTPGTFGSPLTFGGTLGATRCLAVGDLNGDNRADLVVSQTGINSLGVMLNTSNSPLTFGPATSYHVGAGQVGPAQIALGDFDNDGQVDLAAPNPSTDSVTVMLAAPGAPGTYPAAGRTVYPVAQQPQGLVTEDFDMDGRMDLAVAHGTSGNVDVMRNGGGHFALATTSIAPGGGIPNGGVDAMLRMTLQSRGRAGDAAVALSSLHLGFDNGTGAPGSAPLTSAQANALISEVRLYADSNATNIFEAGSDTLVATASSLSLDGQGRMFLSVPTNNAAWQAETGQSRTFFLALQATANAGSQAPNTVRVTHLTASSSTAVDAGNGASLILEYAPDVSTTSGGTALPVGVSGFSLD